jgi:2-hydroxychromene-2-carboxylate isomerase
MTHTLDFYWDFSSPFAYLGSTQVESLASRTGAALRLRPMLLGAVFRAVGQVDVPVAAFGEAKRKHALLDLDRWAAYWGVPFRFPSRFPLRSVDALRVFLALPEERRASFMHATFRAAWVDDRDIGDRAVLASLIGADAEGILAATATPEIKEALRASTQQALDAGVFGAPAFIVDGRDLYWGQDRIPLVERALVSA